MEDIKNMNENLVEYCIFCKKIVNILLQLQMQYK